MYLHGVLTGIGDAPLKTKKTTLDQGRENELVALQAIGTIGWLSTRQVGAWLYPGRPPHTATNKAARVLARLVANGELKRRDEKSEKRRNGANFGIGYYVLTPQGACRANDGLTATEQLESGIELSQLDVGRQRVAVEFLTAAQHRGYRVIGATGLRRSITRAAQAAEEQALAAAEQAQAAEEQEQSPAPAFNAAAYAESVQGTPVDLRLIGADGLLVDPLDALTAVLVVRNLHTELVKKAQRLARAAENLEILGHPEIVKKFRKMLEKPLP